MEKLVNAGFAAKEGSAYRLTEQGKKWVVSEYIMANQSDKLGSEEHKRLMAKTIEKLRKENMLVVTSSAKHSPDLISFPVSKIKRYLWDFAGAMGYEIQTSARKEAIEMNEAKNQSNFSNSEFLWKNIPDPILFPLPMKTTVIF